MNQDNTVTTSDEKWTSRVISPCTVTVNMQQFYPRPGPLCNHGRIYAASFDAQLGVAKIQICYDRHVPNLKVYSVDGITVTNYCFLSEKQILDNVFSSPIFLNWRAGRH